MSTHDDWWRSGDLRFKVTGGGRAVRNISMGKAQVGRAYLDPLTIARALAIIDYAKERRTAA
ncbi:hypothetical protein [Microbispora bryophytorum]|uniref:hypothetical protein n=1 Tax=Microbispora bryophytorum TaxID=1460882 RepID=UPI0033D0F6BB